MTAVLQPWQILVATMAGWIARQQDTVIEYLSEENRVLKQQIGRRRSRLARDSRHHPSPDALWNIGHRVGRTTIAGILKEHGIDPAPERGKRLTWAQFLKAH